MWACGEEDALVRVQRDCSLSKFDTQGRASKPGFLVKGFNLSHHNKETRLFAIDPYYGNLN